MRSNLKLTGTSNTCANSMELTNGKVEISAGEGLLVVFRASKTVKGSRGGPSDSHSSVVKVMPGDNEITLTADTVYDIHGSGGPAPVYRPVYKISAASVLQKTGARTVPYCLEADRLMLFKDGRLEKIVAGVNGNQLCETCRDRTAILVEKCASVERMNSGPLRCLLTDKIGQGLEVVQLNIRISGSCNLGTRRATRKCLSALRKCLVDNPMKQISLKTLVQKTGLTADHVLLTLGACKKAFRTLAGDNLSHQLYGSVFGCNRGHRTVGLDLW